MDSQSRRRREARPTEPARPDVPWPESASRPLLPPPSYSAPTHPAQSHPVPPTPPTPPSRPTPSTDEVRPERSGSDWLSQVAYVLVLCGIAGGLIVVAMNHFKRGGVLIAGVVFLGALARLVLPEGRVGMLAIRGKVFDAALMTSLALALGFVAVGLPPPD
jgi:hypothetical protein